MKEFVGSCDFCAHAKNPHHCPSGLLQPLLIPTSPRSLIYMDFIVDFPLFNSFDSILVAMDCFMKMVHFIFYNKSINGKMTTKLLFNHVFRYHGLLKDIIFYCGPNLHPSSRSDYSSY